LEKKKKKKKCTEGTKRRKEKGKARGQSFQREPKDYVYLLGNRGRNGGSDGGSDSRHFSFKGKKEKETERRPRG